MRTRTLVAGMVVAAFVVSSGAHAQSLTDSANAGVSTQLEPNAAAQPSQGEIRREARRFGVGVQGGVGIDPEMIDFGVHGTFGPVIKQNLAFRPGLEVGVGEVTTFLGINLDFVYAFPSDETNPGWFPYVGAGPTFGLNHRGFETDLDDLDEDRPNRFDFSDTDFNGGMTFMVGMRRASGAFFEMKATAWGVSNIRMVVGFNF